MASPFRSLLLALLLAPFAGCTHVNVPLNPPNVPLESRARNGTRSATFADYAPLAAPSDDLIRRPATRPAVADGDGLFVGIAISGGGSRSANFAAATFFQLQRQGILQRTDYISSVSGGSMTAAYYCLHDTDLWNPRTVQEKLTHHFATDIIVTALLPWNTLALWTTDWDSSDILAATFDRHLFSRDGRSLTFADLRPDRPRLLINATDLQSGKRFVFCNESFDELNSDLGKYPIAHAVAASGAFPVVLHDKTLRDFSTTFRQFRHFIDGGVADNLGIQTLIEVYESQNAPRPDAAAVPYPKGAVLIVIDAGTRHDAKLSDKGDISFWEEAKYGTGLSSTALLARANSATIAELMVEHSSEKLTVADLKQKRRELEETGHLEIPDLHGRPIRVVHVSLARLARLADVPYPSFGESIDQISTFYNIQRTEAYRLYQAADLLLREPRMRERLSKLFAP
jgi:predicted acylesterase/phospholipase RssA